jgi:hypothetical protein
MGLVSLHVSLLVCCILPHMHYTVQATGAKQAVQLVKQLDSVPAARDGCQVSSSAAFTPDVFVRGRHFTAEPDSHTHGVNFQQPSRHTYCWQT